MNTELLKELGLTNAANKIDKGRTLKKKLAVAYEHYRFVEPQVFKRFEEQLRAKTQKVLEPCPKCKNNVVAKLGCGYCQGTGARRMTHDTLAFVPLEVYPEVPPMDCLLELQKAKKLEVFDRFEVAKVETVEVRPDPIIFGLINDCADKFFITQWDDDVKIEDILNQNEG